jgi:hypothetical protein
VGERGGVNTSASRGRRQQAEAEDGSHGGIPPLPLALAAQWAQRDPLALLLTSALQLALLAAGWGSLGRQELLLMGSLLALQLLALLVCAARPRQYVRRYRSPLLAALRIGWLMLVPSAVDLLAVTQQQLLLMPASFVSVDGAQPGAAAAAASTLSAAGQLALPVALLPLTLGAALFWQLPPMAHVVLQLACVGQLVRRAPTGW